MSVFGKREGKYLDEYYRQRYVFTVILKPRIGRFYEKKDLTTALYCPVFLKAKGTIISLLRFSGEKRKHTHSLKNYSKSFRQGMTVNDGENDHQKHCCGQRNSKEGFTGSLLLALFTMSKFWLQTHCAYKFYINIEMLCPHSVSAK